MRPIGTGISLQARITGTDEWAVGEGVIVRAVYSSGTSRTPAGTGVAAALTPSSAELRSYLQSLTPRAQNLIF